MTDQVAIVGIGCVPPRALSPEVSYKELTYQAAVRAYADAGIEPAQVDGFVTCAEDFLEGTSIFDEYTPDQLGAVQKPMHTISGDGIQGLAAAVMQIRAGLMELMVVEAHSKASNVLTLPHILDYATDPFIWRPLGLHPYAIAGMEMRRFLEESGNAREHCARVAALNKGHALLTSAPYAARLTVEEVLASGATFEPLTRLETAPHSDAAYVLVLASAARAKQLAGKPVWVRGVGWASDTPTLETRPWGEAAYARMAGEMAFRQAGIQPSDIGVAEVDDTFAYKELQHLEALGLAERGGSGKALAAGEYERGGKLPVNVSGGSLGQGNQLEASGLARVTEIALQLRGQAGPRQVDGKLRHGLAFGWRGVPTTTGAAVILSTQAA